MTLNLSVQVPGSHLRRDTPEEASLFPDRPIRLPFEAEGGGQWARIAENQFGGNRSKDSCRNRFRDRLCRRFLNGELKLPKWFGWALLEEVRHSSEAKKGQ